MVYVNLFFRFVIMDGKVKVMIVLIIYMKKMVVLFMMLWMFVGNILLSMVYIIVLLVDCMISINIVIRLRMRYGVYVGGVVLLVMCGVIVNWKVFVMISKVMFMVEMLKLSKLCWLNLRISYKLLIELMMDMILLVICVVIEVEVVILVYFSIFGV